MNVMSGLASLLSSAPPECWAVSYGHLIFSDKQVAVTAVCAQHTPHWNSDYEQISTLLGDRRTLIFAAARSENVII